jgi:hypothetical protein
MYDFGDLYDYDRRVMEMQLVCSMYILHITTCYTAFIPSLSFYCAFPAPTQTMDASHKGNPVSSP